MKSGTFDFSKAQDYELKSNISWVDENYDEIIEAMKNPMPYQHYHEFFQSNRNAMDDYLGYVGKRKLTCLEISPGICGALSFWKPRLKGQLIAIDPLLLAYHKYLQDKGGSWFEGIEMIMQKAETFLPFLQGKVDGFIFWRNGINHYEDPYKSIEVVSRYAAKGCRLFFWAEIQHADTPDAGHRNVTSNPQEVEDCILAQGWKLLYHTDNSVFNVPGISYGGVFVMG
jgi:hypothetical protein